MSARTAVGCDACGQVTAAFEPRQGSMAQARVLAREEGWTRMRIRATGLCIDLCPVCRRVKRDGFEVDEFGARR